jgi:hypothetical protein
MELKGHDAIQRWKKVLGKITHLISSNCLLIDKSLEFGVLLVSS